MDDDELRQYETMMAEMDALSAQCRYWAEQLETVVVVLPQVADRRIVEGAALFLRQFIPPRSEHSGEAGQVR